MKKLLSRFAALLLLAIVVCPSAMGQYRYRPHSHHYHSRSGRVLRALDAAETVADYAILGTMLHNISDYTGFRIGYNSASLRASGFDGDISTEAIPALNLGFVFGWDLGHTGLMLEPGFYYSMKGGKLNGYSGHNLRIEEKYTMHSFEIPLVLKYDVFLSPHAALQPFAGAFMSFGFAGTTTFDTPTIEAEYDTFDDHILEDLDAGLRFGIGLSVDNLYLEAAYDLGLTDLCDSYEFSRREDLRSSTWSFSIGVNF